MATWVVGDVHGCYNEFMQLLQNENIKKEDKIILIGDIIDRGPDTLKMIKWAMKHISKTGRYQMILGNHEDNIINDFDNVVRYYKGEDLDDLDIFCLDCHFHFDRYMNESGYETVGSIKEIVDWFKTLPLYKKVIVTNDKGEKVKYVIAHAWYGENMRRDSILWLRDIDDFGNFYNDFGFESKNGEILVHGHTPTICINACMQKDVNEVCFRGNTINIDCGCVFEKYGGNLAAIRLEDQKVIYVREQKKIIP